LGEWRNHNAKVLFTGRILVRIDSDFTNFWSLAIPRRRRPRYRINIAAFTDGLKAVPFAVPFKKARRNQAFPNF